jgi:hypothetical protein
VEESESDYDHDQFWLESQQDMNVREQKDSELDPGCYLVEGEFIRSTSSVTRPKLKRFLSGSHRRLWNEPYTSSADSRGLNTRNWIVRINRNEIREI